MSTHRLRTPHWKTKAATPAYLGGWEATFGRRTTCGECGSEDWAGEQVCGCPGCRDQLDTAGAACADCELPDDRATDPE